MQKNLNFKPFPGLQVFCQKCRRGINKQSSKKDCKHPIDRQIYKANIIVPNSGGKRKTKNLKSRNHDDAIVELLAFKNEVEKPELYYVEEEEKPETLTGCVTMYLDYMADVDVPRYAKKNLDPKYIGSTQTELTDFLEFIKKHIHKEIENYKIENVNKKNVGKYCDLIEDRRQSPYTYNSRIKSLRALFNYLIKEKSYQLKNVWLRPKLKPIKSVNMSIERDDFFDLLDVISPEDSKKDVGKSKKNMYRSYIKDYAKLKAFTGLRNIDVAGLQWNMIHFKEKQAILIESPNTKANKYKNFVKKEDLEYVYIPVGEELKETLINLGLKDKINSDEYILEPKSKNRETIAKQGSRSFTFYWERLERPYHRTVKYLRKTYATQEKLYNNSTSSTLHKNFEVTEKYYINDIDVVKQMVKDKFRIFPRKN